MSKIKFIRNSKGFSQKFLAKSSGMSETELSLVENDKLLPTPQKAQNLCRVLKVKLPQLYSSKEITFSKSDYRTGNKNISNLCVRLNAQARNTYLSDRVISALGYKSIKEWAEIKALETFNESKELISKDSNTIIFEYEIYVTAMLIKNGNSEEVSYLKTVEIDAIDDSIVNTELAKRMAIRSACLTAEIIGGKLDLKTITATIKKCAVKSNMEV